VDASIFALSPGWQEFAIRESFGSEALNVMFAGDPIHYKIPKDIKVSVHDAFK
jgi:hypothetical protein